MRGRERLALLLLGAALGGCGQESAQTPAPGGSERVVKGAVSKGPLTGATVNFFAVDVAGNPTGSALVSPVTTDANGAFTVSGLPSSIPILVETSFGSYLDESDPQANPALRRRITFGATDKLVTVLPVGAATVAITPYSMAMYKKAFIQAAGSNFANTYAAVRAQATSAFGFDPITTIPANPITGAGGSQPYALLLGAAALAINQIAVTGSPGHLPGYADVVAFVNDFADGRLDVASLAGLVRRFRNNNIGVYGASAAPLVDETALSQPANVPNAAPTITAIADQSMGEDGVLSGITFSVADAEDAAGSLLVSFSSSNTALIANPPSSDISANGDSNGNFTLTLTPKPDQFGTTTITITVTDSDSATATEQFLLTVSNVNDPPAISSTIPPTAIEDTLYTYNATVSDLDGPAPTWSTTGADTCGGTINPSSGVYTFTPAGPVPAANCVVGIQVSDGGAPVSQSATVTITPVDDPPSLVVNAGLTVLQGDTAALTALLAASDPDSAGAAIAFAVTTPPANGALEVMGVPASGFTQADLTLGLVSYAHDGSPTASDSFQFALSDAGGFSPDCPSPSPCTFAITVTPAGGAESVLPLLTSAGDLQLVDPTLPVDGVTNPLTIETALPPAGFVARTLQRADVTAGVATNIREARLIYIKAGSVWKVNLEAGQSRTPVQVSNITDACSLNGLAEDFANPDATIVRVDTAGTNGICENGSGDDFTTAQAWLVPLTTGAAQPGVQIGLGHCCGITGIGDAGGNLVGVLTTEDDGAGSTFTLVRRDVGALNSPTPLANFDIAGSGQTFARVARGLGDQHVYIRAFLNGDTSYKLHRLNVGAGTLTPLFDYVTADSAAFAGDFEISTLDSANFYFTSADSTAILRVAHSATGQGQTTTLATVSPGTPIVNIAPTPADLVYATSGISGGILSVPKAGGTPVTLAQNDAVPTIVRLAGANGARVFIDKVAGTASPVLTAFAVDADGANPSADIADAQWAGGTFQRTCDFNQTCEDSIAAETLYLRRLASTTDAQLELADPLTGAPTGTFLGTIFNVAEGFGAFVGGFGRYAQVTVLADVNGQTDLFLGDSQLAGVSPPPEALVPVANVPGGGDNLWLTFGSEDQGVGGGAPPVPFNWTLESTDSGRTVLGDADSSNPVLSGNGRYVVFQSRATNLVSPSPPANVFQVYRRDLLMNTTELVSQNFSQTPGSTDSTDPAVSHDGRFIAFRTAAPEIISALTAQVVLIDMTQPGSFRQVSDSCSDACDFDSTQGRISVSTDGRFVAFLGSDSSFTPQAPDNGSVQAYRADTQTGDVQMVSVDADQTARCGANGGCNSVTMSGDGRWVAWSSTQDSLPGDSNGLSDVLLRDVADGSLRLVSGLGGSTLAAPSAQPFISADGRLLAFETAAALTPFDTNAGADIYVYDIGGDSLARASTGPNGEQVAAGGYPVSAFEDQLGAPVLSGDGRYLMFTSDQDDLATPSPVNTSVSAYLKQLEGVQADGDYAGNIVRAHLNASAEVLDAQAFGSGLDFSGDQLVIYAAATNAVVGDTNAFLDVFAAFHPQFVPDLLRDSDSDGLTDATEQDLGTNPLLRDTDGDGTSDFDEVNRNGVPTDFAPGIDSDPLNPDTDNDDVADGLEDSVGSDPVGIVNTALHVSVFGGNDVECDGTTWDPYPGGTGPLPCALQSNSGVLARLPPSVLDAANTVFVLYEGSGSSYGALSLTGPARQFIAFVGSVGPGAPVPSMPVSSTINAGGSGSAVEISNAQDITIAHFAITNGNAPNGGGVLVHDLSGTPMVTLDHVHVHSNTAGGNGGGIALIGVNPARLTVKQSLIAFNSVSSPSTAYGGGAYASGGRLELFDTLIENNAANGVSTGVGQGGGLYATSSSTVLAERATLRNNTASSLGSGSRGGGIYAGFATVLTLRDSVVSGNRVMPGGTGQADFGGGGLWAGPGDSVSIENSVFADNHSANGPGGGVNFFDTNFVTVTDSRFLSNSSSGFPGAGLHLHIGGGNTTIFNNLFVGNHSDVPDPARPGGGVEIENFQASSSLFFRSNTVAYNQIQIPGSAASGGVNVSVSTPANNEFRNNIVWFNDGAEVGVPMAGDNVVLDNGGTPVVFGTQSGNNVDETGFAGSITADPLFTQGFYLRQVGNASVDGGDDLFDNLFSTLLAYTTDPAGAQDQDQVDIGFHPRSGSAGGLNAVKNVLGSTCVDVPQEFEFVPVFAGAPNGEPGHLIVVEIAGVPNTLSSLTTLDPRASGSRLARDLGDGRYAITVNDDGGGGPATFSVYADDQPAPRTFLVSLITGCS